MKKTMLAAVAAMLMLALCCATALAADAAEVGKEAPDFYLLQLDGEGFHLEDYRGKVVFLNIWATWCPPCVAEMDDIQRLADAHPDDLVVIGVSCDESQADVEKFVAQKGYTYHIAMDDNYLIAGGLYPSYYIPNSIFISPDGTVVSIDAGGAAYETMEERYLAALNY